MRNIKKEKQITSKDDDYLNDKIDQIDSASA